MRILVKKLKSPFRHLELVQLQIEQQKPPEKLTTKIVVKRAEVQTFGLFSQLRIILIDLRAVPGVVALEKESTRPGRSSCAVELKLDS